MLSHMHVMGGGGGRDGGESGAVTEHVLQCLFITFAGWQQLCVLDARFEPFGKSLFAAGGAAPAGRDQLTPDAAARLDASVASFCLLLSDYFLLPPAFKALEYLVHRYK